MQQKTNRDMEKTYNIGDYDTWRFIEENLPNYHQRDDVLYNDLVSRYVNGEDMDENDFEMINNHFGGKVDVAEKWLDADIKRLFLEAVEAAFDSDNISTITIKK